MKNPLRLLDENVKTKWSEDEASSNVVLASFLCPFSVSGNCAYPFILSISVFIKHSF